MSSPNFIVILLDDLGYGDLGCYGSTTNRTPRLDCMAREGAQFTEFHSPSPVCSPARAALLTGCYPKRVGLATGSNFCVMLPGDHAGLNPDEITIAKLLKSRGYRTHLTGKWHLGDQPEFLPLRHGFDSWFGLPYSNDLLPAYHLQKRFTFPPLPLMRNDEVLETEPDQSSLSDRYTADAVRFIRECVEEKQPFFLYFAHMYVHIPIYPPMDFLIGARCDVYTACVEHLDYLTGMIFDTLAECGIDENTMVVFTSDHGADLNAGGSNGPLRAGKGSTWEGGMRVACLMRWPGRIPAGTRCDTLVNTMDLFPTIAAAADAALPSDRKIDGENLLPLLEGGADENAGTFAKRPFYYYGMGNDTLEAVRLRNWKWFPLRRELYELGRDVGETTNVAEQHPKVVAELESVADAARRDLGDAATGVEGANCRPRGWVKNPRTLTSFDDIDPDVRRFYEKKRAGRSELAKP